MSRPPESAGAWTVEYEGVLRGRAYATAREAKKFYEIGRLRVRIVREADWKRMTKARPRK